MIALTSWSEDFDLPPLPTFIRQFPRSWYRLRIERVVDSPTPICFAKYLLDDPRPAAVSTDPIWTKSSVFLLFLGGSSCACCGGFFSTISSVESDSESENSISDIVYWVGMITRSVCKQYRFCWTLSKMSSLCFWLHCYRCSPCFHHYHSIDLMKTAQSTGLKFASIISFSTKNRFLATEEWEENIITISTSHLNQRNQIGTENTYWIRVVTYSP